MTTTSNTLTAVCSARWWWRYTMVLLPCLLAVIFVCKVTQLVFFWPLEVLQPFLKWLQKGIVKRSLYESATMLVMAIVESVFWCLTLFPFENDRSKCDTGETRFCVFFCMATKPARTSFSPAFAQCWEPLYLWHPLCYKQKNILCFNRILIILESLIPQKQLDIYSIVF